MVDLEEASADVQQALQVGGADLSESYQVAAAVELERSRAAARANKPEEAAQHRAAAKEFAEKGLKAPSPDPRLYLLLAEIEVQLHSERQQADVLKAAEERLRAGLDRVAEARKELEPGDFERAQRLVETEVQLRWTLTDFVIDRLAIAEDDQEKSALKEAAAKELVALRESGCRPELVEFHEGRLLLRGATLDRRHRCVGAEPCRPHSIPGAARANRSPPRRSVPRESTIRTDASKCFGGRWQKIGRKTFYVFILRSRLPMPDARTRPSKSISVSSRILPPLWRRPA